MDPIFDSNRNFVDFEEGQNRLRDVILRNSGLYSVASVSFMCASVFLTLFIDPLIALILERSMACQYFSILSSML